MRLPKIILFIIIFPITFFLDYLLFASGTKCAGCGSFAIWLTSPESFSFPIITALYTLGNGLFSKFHKHA
ncbi:hypothetical protein HYW54_02500 [Candidatus Gottesmanbacteria bacterium]|nr:hypothetical protein [Candidatus Gottesmanbacteria bacterium]